MQSNLDLDNASSMISFLKENTYIMLEILLLLYEIISFSYFLWIFCFFYNNNEKNMYIYHKKN